MITYCDVIVILRIAEGICPTMICDLRFFRYVNLRNTKSYLAYINKWTWKHNIPIWHTYTQVTLALHQMLIDSTISFSAVAFGSVSRRRHFEDRSRESDLERWRTRKSLGSLGDFLLFLVLAGDLDRGDLDRENGLEDLDRSFRRFFEEHLKVPHDRERERLFLCSLVFDDRSGLELVREICLVSPELDSLELELESSVELDMVHPIGESSATSW